MSNSHRRKHARQLRLQLPIRLGDSDIIYVEDYFEFPSGMRHICTTMPWTILPSLLILWGVCWMFYWPEEHDKEHGALEDQTLPVSVQDHWLNEYVDFSTPKVDDCWPLDTPFVATNISPEAVTTTFQDMNVPDVSANTTLAKNTNTANESTFLCLHCNKTYSRADALKRHRRERHPSSFNEDGGGKVFLCPHTECHKPFKRYERLQTHLKTCKVQKRIESRILTAMPAGSEAAVTPILAEALRPESEASTQCVPMSESDGGNVTSQMEQGGDDVIELLQRRVALEKEKLKEKERECRQSKSAVARIEALIKALQNGSE